MAEKTIIRCGENTVVAERRNDIDREKFDSRSNIIGTVMCEGYCCSIYRSDDYGLDNELDCYYLAIGYEISDFSVPEMLRALKNLGALDNISDPEECEEFDVEFTCTIRVVAVDADEASDLASRELKTENLYCYVDGKEV